MRIVNFWKLSEKKIAREITSEPFIKFLFRTYKNDKTRIKEKKKEKFTRDLILFAI